MQRHQLDPQSQGRERSITLQSTDHLGNFDLNSNTAPLAETREEVLAEDLLDVLDAASVQHAKSYNTFAEWSGLLQVAHKV